MGDDGSRNSANYGVTFGYRGSNLSHKEWEKRKAKNKAAKQARRKNRK